MAPGPKRPPAGPKANRLQELAQTLNALAPNERSKLLANVARQDPQLAIALEQFLFRFEDLAKLRPEHMLLVIQKCERQDILLALKKCDEQIRNLILATQTNRAKQALLDELGALPPTPLSEVTAAQSRIAAVAKDLEDSGLISRSGDDWV